MKVVAFFGTKGGTGKSTLSHLLAYGASLHGLAALVVHTDARAPEVHQGRPYHYFDGRDPARLYALLERAKSTDAGLCVIDGAGNRPGLSATLAKAADLVLIPCGIGGQDAPLALADLAQLPAAWLIINRWPTLPKHPRRPKAEAYIAQLPAERILCRLGESVAADRFTEPDLKPWTTPSARVNSAARAIYRRIADQLDA
jgi:chromosome partitioning protein